MKSKISILIALISIAILQNGCTTVGEVRELNPETGRIDIRPSFSNVTPKILKSEKVDIEQYKGLLLVLGGDFFVEQSKLIGYFDKVVDRTEMEKLLITENMTDLVSDVTNYISWKKISDSYGVFLVLKPEIRDEGRKEYLLLKVIDPSTAEDLFVSEVKLDYALKGVHDDTVFYPIYNSFLDWLETNSGQKPGSR